MNYEIIRFYFEGNDKIKAGWMYILIDKIKGVIK